MKLHELTAVEGSTKERKRIGRGHGSGQGKTAGKGHKGQKARSGGSIRPGFEGGQMPLQRRVPKRGFNNIFAKKIVAINVSDLNVGIVKKEYDGRKILGNGEISKKLTVKVAAYSESAKQKIEAAGGKAEVV